MTKPVYIPLRKDGKQPAVKGWADPSYKGVELKGRVGRRADGLVIIDCDSEEAAADWRQRAPVATLTVKTPRGWHFYYEAGPGDPTGPAVDALPGVDVRAGAGSYVVCPPTPGYSYEGRRRKPVAFQQKWLPRKTQAEVLESTADTWDVIPEGRRNATLAAFAGTFRKQGMDPGPMYQLLQGINAGLCDPPLPNDELEVIVRSVSRYEPDPAFEIQLVENDASDGSLWLPLSGMRLPPPPEWWWRPYIPKGRLVLLDGSEGIGKGLLCCHLATMITGEAPVLWCAAEDDPEEDIQRRMLASGWTPKSNAEVLFATADPKFPRHAEVIESEIVRLGAGMLVLDPGRSYLAPPDDRQEMSYNNEAALRPGLQELNRMAKRTGCTILFVHHWNKNSQASVQYRQGGSGAFSQVVRHRITMAWHGPTIGGSGAFEVNKTNITSKGHVHGYAVDVHDKLDTASFRPTTALESFPDLGEWMKGQEELDKGIDVVDSRHASVESLLGSHPAGLPVPNMRELVKRTGMEKDEIAEALDGLLEAGTIRQGPRRQLFVVQEGERAD